MKKNGLFVAIEGIDGCGKTTLINLLKEQLTHDNIPVLFTKEPGGSAIGKPLRALLQDQPVALDAKTEYLLFAADRAQHMRDIIMPGIEQGKLVITDRCADSSLAYQGYGLGLDKEMIKQVNRWAMNDIQPDAVIYLRINPELAMERIKQHRSHLTTFELRPLNFWEKVYRGYEEIFSSRNNIIIVDASRSPQDVLHETYEKLTALLTL